jgi:di/tricarboxylate transporter
MSWEAWVVLAVVVAVFVALWNNWATPDVVLVGGAILLTTIGLAGDTLPSPRELASQFGNEGVLTVGMLFVAAAGLTETGGLQLITDRLLGVPRSVRNGQLRLMLPVVGASAFLNNTPVVAMFIPVVNDWCKKSGLSPSKLFIPLSYAAILGGTCTLIGTSTNLVVQAQLVAARQTDPSIPLLGMFTLTPVGLPVALAGVAFILLASNWLLPERRAFLADVADARQYTIEMLVEPGSAVAGQTIERAGLRRLPGAFLSAIERDGETLVAVGPEQVLRAHDRLVFVGVVDSIIDLQRIRGLVPATDEVFKVTASRLNHLLIEVVVSGTSGLVGRSIRESHFRTRYDAAVIAVYRDGERIQGKIGDIRIAPGDALLLQGHPDFVSRHRNDRDFLLVSAVDGARPVRHERGWLAVAILAVMVVVASLEGFLGVSVFLAATLGAAAMLATGCLSTDAARKSVDLPVLVGIVGALVIGQAIQKTGLGDQVAAGIIGVSRQFGPWGVLAGVYLLTLFFTELVTNNAAVALAFPIAQAAAAQMGVPLLPFAIAVAIAASAGFATPLGYQTHLMVYGPGGYRFADFARIGLPLDLLCMAVTVALVPVFHPFR